MLFFLFFTQVDQQTPWVGAGIGLIIGVLIVVGDAVLAKQSVLSVSSISY